DAGSATTSLAHDPTDDASSPAWSPDGSHIALTRYTPPPPPPGGEIYAMSADGSNQVNLTNDPADDYTPNWSPDGTKIAFARWPGSGGGEIYVMNADGSGQSRL